MTTKDNGGPAFPGGLANVGDGDSQPYAPGMTLHDWFAGQALAGIMANPQAWLDEDGVLRPERAANRVADAMIAERAKQ